MIKLEWICDECKIAQVYKGANNDLLDVSEVIELECRNCFSQFELVMNRR